MEAGPKARVCEVAGALVKARAHLAREFGGHARPLAFAAEPQLHSPASFSGK